MFAPKPFDVAAEMVRVTRPGGRIVLVNMTPPDNRLSRRIYMLGAKRLGGWNDVWLESSLHAAGFQLLRREVVHQLALPSEILLARRAP